MSSSSSRQHPPSAPSTTSLGKQTSLRSFKRPPPPVTTVVTAPPWAKDEPPSPKEPTGSIHEGAHGTESRISDVASFQSRPPQQDSHWWTFTIPRTRSGSQGSFDRLTTTNKPERRGFKEISLSWMPTSSTLREGTSFMRKESRDKEKAAADIHNLSVTIPPPPTSPNTLANAVTPGWDTPWTARLGAQGPARNRRDDSYGFQEDDLLDGENHQLSTLEKKTKRLRSFVLNNIYVPLLFRFLNVVFTTAALGMAIRIRNIEIKHGALGAVGSSPNVVIIFAPLTLLHVMLAIYLEYFGRPLGLWRTSAKLAHTLSEVLFICAWSAALSLCFDNFFTSLIPCASPSAISWYNQLPRPHSDVPGFEGSLGDRICDHQLSLICLVGVGLIAYCTNLIISLYRIFEKIKYQPGAHSLSVFPRPS